MRAIITEIYALFARAWAVSLFGVVYDRQWIFRWRWTTLVNGQFMRFVCSSSSAQRPNIKIFWPIGRLIAAFSPGFIHSERKLLTPGPLNVNFTAVSSTFQTFSIKIHLNVESVWINSSENLSRRFNLRFLQQDKKRKYWIWPSSSSSFWWQRRLWRMRAAQMVRFDPVINVHRSSFRAH